METKQVIEVYVSAVETRYPGKGELARSICEKHDSVIKASMRGHVLPGYEITPNTALTVIRVALNNPAFLADYRTILGGK